jgi:cobalt/nickel transport system permease protein
MHIPDAVLDPRVAALTGVMGAAGLYYGLRSVEGQLKERTTSLMGMMSAFIFAAQMVNFPVGPGVSGHLLGGVLAAVMLGPWAGAVVIAAVLIVQCFLFGDGGLTALGANFVNMGLIGSVVGYAIYAPIRRWIGGQRGILIAAMIAGWFTVLLAAGACAAELSASGNHRDFFRILSWMALVHAVIGLGEAIITGLVVRFILLTRPDLIEQDPTFALEPQVSGGGPPRRWLATILGGLGVALAVVVFLRWRPSFPTAWSSSARGSGSWPLDPRPHRSRYRCRITSFLCRVWSMSRPRRRSRDWWEPWSSSQ